MWVMRKTWCSPFQKDLREVFVLADFKSEGGRKLEILVWRVIAKYLFEETKNSGLSPVYTELYNKTSKTINRIRI